MVETCILPILLYGAENWCLSQNSVQMLDSFLGELSKRLLKLPRCYSNTPASIVIGLRSARALCLTRKLNFLKKITDSNSETVSSRTLTSLSDDLDSVCLICECRDLEKFLIQTSPRQYFSRMLILASTHTRSQKTCNQGTVTCD